MAPSMLLWLGMSRQTVNQVLQRLKCAGLIKLAYNRVEILDLASLQAKVRFQDWLPVSPEEQGLN